MGQASLDALKAAETITLTGQDFPAFGKVTVTAGVEKLGQASSVSAVASASATGGKGGSSLTTTMADSPAGSGVIGNPGITSISGTTNPVGGGVVGNGVAKTSSGAVAIGTTSGTVKATNTSTAKQAAATNSKSAASGLSVANGCSILVGMLAVILFL